MAEPKIITDVRGLNEEIEELSTQVENLETEIGVNKTKLQSAYNAVRNL